MTSMAKHMSAPKRRWRREAILKRDGNQCAWCGVTFTDENPSTLDHVIPRSRGGSNHIRNLVLACNDCQQQRGCDHIPEWIGSVDA